MKQATVFVTYNPGNEFEQTLAVRLHTIGAVHGFNMLMPERFYNSDQLNGETIHRIKSSDYFIFFSTSQLTPIVQKEISTAFTHLKDKSKIVIIYNKVKNIHHNEKKCTEVFIDTRKDSPNVILEKVIEEIKQNQSGIKKSATQEDTTSILGGILLVGLGLLALDSIFNSKK